MMVIFLTGGSVRVWPAFEVVICTRAHFWNCGTVRVSPADNVPVKVSVSAASSAPVASFAVTSGKACPGDNCGTPRLVDIQSLQFWEASTNGGLAFLIDGNFERG